MDNKAPPTRWTSQVIPIDIETGEILDTYQVESDEYLVVKKTTSVSRKDQEHAIRIISWHCRRNHQTTLDLD